MSLVEKRYGICRTVYLVGPWAIKTPRLRLPHPPPSEGGAEWRVWSLARGVQANLSERQWGGVEGVAPVLWSLLGVVNIYPRCQPWEGPEPDYDAIGVGWLPRDRKPENIGLLDGEPVWIDYDGSWNGCPHSRNVAGLTMEDDE